MKESIINCNRIINRGGFILGILLVCNLILFYIPFFNKKIEIKKITPIDNHKSEVVLLNPIEKEMFTEIDQLYLVDSLQNKNKCNLYMIEKNNKIILSHKTINLKVSYVIKLDLNLLQLINKNFN